MKSFNWCGFYKLAIYLQRSSKESDWRTSISRFYYSIFKTLHDRLIEDGSVPERGVSEVHSKIINTLKESEDGHNKRFGLQLDRLKFDRVNADYFAKKMITQKDAKEAWNKTKNLFKLLPSVKTDFDNFKFPLM